MSSLFRFSSRTNLNKFGRSWSNYTSAMVELSLDVQEHVFCQNFRFTELEPIIAAPSYWDEPAFQRERGSLTRPRSHWKEYFAERSTLQLLSGQAMLYFVSLREYRASSWLRGSAEAVICFRFVGGSSPSGQPYSERAAKLRENEYRDDYSPRNTRWCIEHLRFRSLDRSDGGIWLW